MNFLETISYDSDTGVFTWAVSRRGCAKGTIAGHINKEGYRIVKVGRKAYPAHRLAWFIVHNQLPEFIDHINGRRDDNRISNLRSVSHSENMQNKREAMVNNRSSGLLGVTWNKQHKRWQSKLMISKKAHHIGYFDTPESAHAAYLYAKRRLHPACTI